MEGYPSKAKLFELADAIDSCDCERPERPDCPREYIAKATRILRKLAAEQEPEEPKVESLRKAALRIFNRNTPGRLDTADMCAIVLREVGHIWKWLDMYEASEVFADSPRCRDITRKRAEIKQMLDGSEDRKEGE